jgi:serine/threonine protein kinase
VACSRCIRVAIAHGHGARRPVLAVCGTADAPPAHGSAQPPAPRPTPTRGAYPSLPAHVSPDARSMVRRLLAVDPAQRMTWDELNRHPWVLAGPAALCCSRDAPTWAADGEPGEPPAGAPPSCGLAGSSSGGLLLANGGAKRPSSGQQMHSSGTLVSMAATQFVSCWMRPQEPGCLGPPPTLPKQAPSPLGFLY